MDSINSISEYISSGYFLTFTKNLIIMRWQNFEEDSVVNSKEFTEFGGDAMLLSALSLLKRKIDRRRVSREKRNESRYRCLEQRKIPNLLA